MDWYRDKSYANQNKVKFPGKDTSDVLVDLNHESRFNLQKSRFFGPEKNMSNVYLSWNVGADSGYKNFQYSKVEENRRKLQMKCKKTLN